ncbi:alpha/beta hydrolase [Clostridium thermarum]|uniref:alpha/beta hydrolase n=1 Tax=Clostridium thermarum TaxID=1716543 RepID=UPI0013D6600E|nr:alpha/beta hydrolase [Clostridium thermarum]
MSYLIILLFIIILSLLIASYKFAKIVMYPKVWKYEETLKNEIQSKRIKEDYLDNIPKEELLIDSPYDYKLHAFFFPNKDSKKTIIFAHGVTYSLWGSIKYMDIFYKQGFNVFVYDHRFHGKSEGPCCTYGYYEKYDLKTCADWIFNRIGTDSIVGIHGESMGAATALQNSEIDNRISFYIADCPYSDFIEELKIRIKEDYHLPPFPFIQLAGLFYRIKTGATLKSASPINAIKNVETPILFIHGANDNYIPNSMSRDMYNIKKGYKKLYISSDADHAQSVWKNPAEYEKVVVEFLKEIMVI